MAIQLMKLRNVPPDELAEIHALLEAHEIACYETSAGNWGISLPALWLRDAGQLTQAKKLLATYEKERYARARSEFEARRAEGKTRTIVDIARENPLRFIAYLVTAGVLVYFSTVPFLQLTG
jgi:hypothetical protein